MYIWRRGLGILSPASGHRAGCGTAQDKYSTVHTGTQIPAQQRPQETKGPGHTTSRTRRHGRGDRHHTSLHHPYQVITQSSGQDRGTPPSWTGKCQL